jgi:hypothetical protein
MLFDVWSPIVKLEILFLVERDLGWTNIYYGAMVKNNVEFLLSFIFNCWF